jgi:T4-like virus Myoviridae tail sheath stabiliser
MIQYTYDWEIQTLMTMFMNSMSDIVIKRFNVHKQPQDQIKTRLVYAPKQRVLNDLLDKDQNLQLPVMACYIGGIARDNNRVFNKILGNYQQTPSGTSAYNEKMPLPIDLSINVSIMTRYQADMDQIISHLIPYINPYFTVSWRTPGRPDYEIRSNVFWGGNVNITYPMDSAATQVARVVADLSFTFKGWMFQAKGDDVGTILTIHSNFNAVETGIPMEYLLTEQYQTSIDSADNLTIDGKPPRPKVVEPYFAQIGTRQQFNVFGSGFEKIHNVYLSGAPLSSLMTAQNPFSASVTLSGEFPSFTGAKLLSSDWSYDKDSFMTFVMPSASSTGFVDIVVEGPAGYGTLTQGVRYNNFNPFTVGTPEHDSFVPYQFPFLSGIQINF